MSTRLNLPARLPLPTRLPSFGLNLCVALVLWICGWVSLHHLFLLQTNLPLLWLPTGVGVGLLLRKRALVLPGVIVGLMWANLHGGIDDFVIGTARDLMECACAHVLLRRRDWDHGFGRAVDVLRFEVLGVVLGPVAGLGASLLAMECLGRGEQLGPPSWAWLMAHMVAAGLLVPAITLFERSEWRAMPVSRRVLMGLVLVAAPLAVLWQVNTPMAPDLQGYPLVLLPFPLMGWLVIGVSVSVAMSGLLLMGLVLITGTALGHGYFAAMATGPLQLVVSIHVFLGMLSASALLMGALHRHQVRERVLTRAALEQARLCLWTWRPGVGLVVDNAAWALALRTQPGQRVEPARVEPHVASVGELSILCRACEQPNLEEEAVEEFRLHLPDGSWRWVQCRRLTGPVGHAQIPGAMHGILQDVTEQKEAEQARLDALVKEAELRNLKRSIHPHFLFNSLNTLRSLIASRPDDARQVVTMLATYLRSTIAPAEEDVSRLGTELEFTLNYLRIEQFRFGERLRLRTELPGGSLHAKVPPMVLQTLVENAVKYGVARRPEGGEIFIQAKVGGGRLVLSVYNEGGIVPTPEGSLGTGLKHVQARLRLIYGAGEASIELVEHAGPKVEARLSVPYACEGAQSRPPWG